MHPEKSKLKYILSPQKERNPVSMIKQNYYPTTRKY